MVDSVSKIAMEEYGYRCFGKATINSDPIPENLTDLTDTPNKIYFSSMNNLLFIFKKEGHKNFNLSLSDFQPCIYFEGCELIKGLTKIPLENYNDFLVRKIDLRLDSKMYLHLKEKFTEKEILDIIDNPKEIYFDYDFNLISKEEYYNILNEKGIYVDMSNN